MASNPLLSKLDFAGVIAVLSAVLYLWGWLYWDTYFAYFGLPNSFGNFSFQRLLLSGSWYLYEFMSWAVLLVVPMLFAFHVLRKLCSLAMYKYLAPRFAGVLTCPWEEISSPSVKLLVFAGVVFVVGQAYLVTLRYVTHDARDDAQTRRYCYSPIVVTTSPKYKGRDLSVDSFRLFDAREGKLYFLSEAQNRITIVRESDIASMVVQTCSRH